MAISFCKKNGKYVDRILQQKQIKEIKKEIFRKLIHLCAAFIPFLLNIFYWPIIVLLSFVLCFYIIVKDKPKCARYHPAIPFTTAEQTLFIQQNNFSFYFIY